MRYVMLAGAIVFPLLDFYVTLRFSAWSGVPAWAWFAAGVLAGWILLFNERNAFRDRTLAALTGDQPLVRALFDSGRKVLAAILFILPGIMSDCLALILLLLPFNLPLRPQTVTPNRPQVFEGDYRRTD